MTKSRSEINIPALYRVIRRLRRGPSARWNERISRPTRDHLKALLGRVPHPGVIIDLGSGDRKARNDAVAVDRLPLPGVDIVADIASLPFPSAHADLMVLRGTIEHLIDPVAALSEIRRVLKPTGNLFIDAPFLCRKHDFPDDYYRWTTSGFARLLHPHFVIEHLGISSGPCSALSELVRQVLSLLLSFRSERLYELIYRHFAGYITWPIKYIDVLVNDHPASHRAAFGFFAVCRPLTGNKAC